MTTIDYILCLQIPEVAPKGITDQGLILAAWVIGLPAIIAFLILKYGGDFWAKIRPNGRSAEILSTLTRIEVLMEAQRVLSVAQSEHLSSLRVDYHDNLVPSFHAMAIAQLVQAGQNELASKEEKRFAEAAVRYEEAARKKQEMVEKKVKEKVSK